MKTTITVPLAREERRLLGYQEAQKAWIRSWVGRLKMGMALGLKDLQLEVGLEGQTAHVKLLVGVLVGEAWVQVVVQDWMVVSQ